MEHHSRIKGILLVIIASTLWGISGTVAQFLFQKQGFATQWLVAVRLLASGLLLLFYIAAKGEKNIWDIWKTKESGTRLLVFAILGMLGVQYSYFAAVQHGNAATATILQYLAPVIITGYLVIRNRRMPVIRELAAVALAVIGTFLMITNGSLLVRCLAGGPSRAGAMDRNCQRNRGDRASGAQKRGRKKALITSRAEWGFDARLKKIKNSLLNFPNRLYNIKQVTIQSHRFLGTTTHKTGMFWR